MKIKQRKSKRIPCAHRYRVEKKQRERERKRKRDARRNPIKSRNPNKDLRVPNCAPFKVGLVYSSCGRPRQVQQSPSCLFTEALHTSGFEGSWESAQNMKVRLKSSESYILSKTIYLCMHNSC